MATTHPTTIDAPTLPTTDYAWPTLERDGHDPEYLVTNDPTPSEETTLVRYTTIARYEAGEMVWQIAADLPTDCETVARELRQAGVLKPHDDPRALAHLYHAHDHTLESLAALFDHARGSESIRSRMEKYGIERDGGETVDLLDDLNPEDVGLSSTTDDSHSKFTKRGQNA